MAWQDLLHEFENQAAEIRLGGGRAAIERQHAKGRRTARERIAMLIDADTDFLEVGLWRAWGMYADVGVRRPPA